ncbi:2,3,4,5-tetrahydropyridine-2,6-dicarboxylate N-succinyltransferase [Buchnera aphidicola]|uniref:2,3,4,5-tetrahydropyridine-2,6-dicarboxylate N-succinyltransferase n=1 Tax=Buchnera aphidicola str. Ua (Uroleucon ambrosiae) TaxID=1005057 RepID=G2LP96_BUCUM|nr:2,3,4,5-tetrahydropyridine-2,6-dicarboxylate N-succinyltransferase [Buchnera aphidicola]AEO08033.1 2,3,4,5-tetrahydropyridine-2,6-carboxylate N-succinyltransferase [Buchnera aphidicola str. Ua (Uroleucon ambrosiae)]
MRKLKQVVEKVYKNKNKINFNDLDHDVIKSIFEIITLLNSGSIRIAEKKDNIWITHEWLKKAVLLYMYIKQNRIIKGNHTNYYDKIPLKYEQYNEDQFQKEQIRIVPPATIRYGAFINYKTVIMPSYINIGSYIDTGSMIDTWATIGSCAQIGKNVHISGGVGIGGVLEPLQNNPTIIEDNCFIGARSEIVEGVIIETGSVISMGVFIGQSTKIYDRENDKIFYGKVPANSVVVSGSLPSKNKKYNLYAAIIVKKVDSKTLKKTEINQLLRHVT